MTQTGHRGWSAAVTWASCTAWPCSRWARCSTPRIAPRAGDAVRATTEQRCRRQGPGVSAFAESTANWRDTGQPCRRRCGGDRLAASARIATLPWRPSRWASRCCARSRWVHRWRRAWRWPRPPRPPGWSTWSASTTSARRPRSTHGSLIADGVIGDISFFRGEHTEDFYADPSLPASWRSSGRATGTLGDLSSHMINAALALAGPIEAPCARMCRPCTHRARPSLARRRRQRRHRQMRSR